MRGAVVVFAIAVVASAVAHVAILASVVRNASAPVDPSLPRPRRITEVVWALIPALALALVFTATWSRVSERGATSDPPAAVGKIAR